MKKYIVIIILVCYNCASKYDGIHVESISSELLENENRYDFENSIYTLNKDILFSFSSFKNELPLPSEIKYIKMSILGTTAPFSRIDPDYSQTVIKFDYLDKAYSSLDTEKTGLIENDKNIWFHPSRSQDAGILQLSAFPYIKLTNQGKWRWKLDAAFENYKDVRLKHSYQKLKTISHETDFGILKCVPVLAVSKSHLGRTTSKFLFNEQYGFVKLEFNNIDSTTIILEMIE